MTKSLEPSVIGQDMARVDGRAKVAGAAPYAYDHEVANPAYVWPILSTVERGRITGIDTSLIRQDDVLLVLSHENAPTLSTEDRELAILQSAEVNFRGEIVGGRGRANSGARP